MPSRPSGRWLARGRRACLLALAAVAVAGCVGMPNSGSPGTISATPQDSTPDSDFIGALPAGPQPNWRPTEIVAGFLNASANPVYSSIAKQYLVSSLRKGWGLGWPVTVVDQVKVPSRAVLSPGGRQAVVDVTGSVQASFNGTGQYVGAQQGRRGAVTADQHFVLVKENGQWRITNPPPYRMLTQPDFAEVYRPQDLYFYDSTEQVLVPDAVFVPSGTSSQSLVRNLVGALLADPQTGWLQSQANSTPAAVTAFPAHTKILNVAVDGTTATVNLGGPAADSTTSAREQMSAQLVWTLTAQQALTGPQGTPPGIQAVQLEINGVPWTPPAAPCPGVSTQSLAQKWAMYSCKNPYPAATSSAFYYVAAGQAWFRCASESLAMAGSVGAVRAVFSRTGVASLSQSCGGPVLAGSPTVPPPQPRGLPPLSRVAASPDGKYVAGVSADARTVYIWASGSTKAASTLSMPGVTAICWDRRDYLWVAQGATISMVVQTGTSSSHDTIPTTFPGKVLGLAIAPDGVRVAAIVQTASGPEVELAAIDSGAAGPEQLTNPFNRTSIGPVAQLAPNVTNPIALTWYDADNLLVLDGPSSGATLWKVPLDGQPAARQPGVLPGAISITANSASNALVLGLTNNRLDVSASLEGPWQPLFVGGQNPAFPPPASPAAAQP